MERSRQVSATLAAKIQAAQSRGGHGRRLSVGGGAHLAGVGTRDEPVRRALGPTARGHRHRRASGTPIRAAAAGTVIYAGWLGGYGNLVVIDHGNGLATAYGHQSSIAVRQAASTSRRDR